MGTHLYLRMASAASLLALAFVFVGLDPFLGDPSAAGTTPTVSVDRSLKGDRLPVSSSSILTAPERQGEAASPANSGPAARTPVGCDAAFSQISASPADNVYGRCTV
jgi:hypothetical protein